jgi:hypothetical protein
MYKIINLIIGVAVAAAIPLGMLKLAIWYAKKTDKNK